VKFSVARRMPKVQLNADEKAYFKVLSEKLEGAEWNADSINSIVTEEAKASPLGSKKGFQALYKIIIQRTAGPRLGSFLATMDKKFVMERLKEASQ